VLLLDERYPASELAGFEVVTVPQEDVVAVLTLPRKPVGEELMAQLSALRVVGTASVGFDHIDVEAAERRGVAVVSAPDYCTEEVADHTLALLYALLRGVVELDRSVARGEWSSKAAGPLRTLAGLRVGIVGLGRIGNAVATRLLALGAEGVGDRRAARCTRGHSVRRAARVAGPVRCDHVACPAHAGDARSHRF